MLLDRAGDEEQRLQPRKECSQQPVGEGSWATMGQSSTWVHHQIPTVLR